MKPSAKAESAIIFIDEEHDQPVSKAWDKDDAASSSSFASDTKKLIGNRSKNRQRTTFRTVQEDYKRNRAEEKKFCHPFPSTFTKYLFSEKSVLMRLLASLVPPLGQFKRVPVDKQGSFLSWFLLTLTLYWGFYSKGESRLYALASSCAHTTAYIIFLTGFTWVFSFCTQTRISFWQILCILGYGLFGHALTLLACELGSDQWFLPLLTVLGGLDSMRICLIIFSRTPIPACRFVLCTTVATIHLLYLVYLHFAIMRDE